MPQPIKAIIIYEIVINKQTNLLLCVFLINLCSVGRGKKMIIDHDDYNNEISKFTDLSKYSNVELS